jgi:cysteinyl-tRNA synthetase
MDRGELDSASADSWLNWWERVNSVLRLPTSVQLRASLDMKGELQAAHIPAEIAELVRRREEARLAKDFQKSDELRDELSARGWEMRDTKEGYTITQRAGG